MTCALTLLLLSGLAASPGDADVPADGERDDENRLEELSDDLASYTIFRGADLDEKLEFQPVPVLHWNNLRAGQVGVTFVWTRDGRPEVVGQAFTWVSPFHGRRRKHALHSLAQVPLAAEYAGRRVWSPKRPGIEWKPISDARPPAESDRLRLVQMRSLARQFTVRLTDTKRQVTELRLMPQPLYRYEAPGVVDGAIFGFADGTDPEALLLLEAAGEEAEASWRFAFARFHYLQLQAEHRGDEVWSVPADMTMERNRVGNPLQVEKVYNSFHVLD
jgi:hypothetical protein